MTVFAVAVVGLLVCFGLYLAVGFLRLRSRPVSRETDKPLEVVGVEEAWPAPVISHGKMVYDPALAAPKLLREDWAVFDHPQPVPELESEPGPVGVYNVVYWSEDRQDRREKQLWAENPNQARQIADEHEAEYVRETGAPAYSFSRIDHPEE